MNIPTPQSPMPRRLLACADDLGADPANDACILELLDAGRLSGASVLVDAPHAATALRRHAASSFGLHLNLTQDFGQGFAVQPIAVWIARAWRGALRPGTPLAQAVAAELGRQLDRFAALSGRLPQYVDGHEHVHGLPGIARLVADAMQARGGAARVRSVRSQRWRGIKAWIIGTACGQRDPRSVAMNADFAGVYRFDQQSDGRGDSAYATRVNAWLAAASDRTLLMCHPGSANTELPHAADRAAEYRFFRGTAWEELRQRQGWRLERVMGIEPTS